MTSGHVVQVVRSDAFAGVERYVADTATELHRRGWRVTVIGGDADQMRDELPGGVAYLRAATVVDVAKALWRVERCDIVHAHMTAAELPAVVFKRRLGARLVVTRHFASKRGRSLRGGLVAAAIARRVDRQVAISHFVAKSLHEPSTVVHNGVRLGESIEQSRADVVVMLQRLEREKDTATALRAWAISGLGARGWRLEICGRGSQADTLRALARDLRIDESVDFRGFVPAPRARLGTAAIMLATASAEPFGLSVVEAMAEGTPVVASDSGAHRETLGRDGLYFVVGDAEDCAAQLVRLAGDAGLRAELGVRLQTRQRAEFSVAKHVDRLEQVYAS